MNTTKKIFLLAILLFAVSTMVVQAQYDTDPRKNLSGDLDEPDANVVERQHYKERFPIQYPPLREADLMWQRRIWREIDFIQKQNHAFYFPTEPKYGRASFASVVIDSIKAGHIIAYEHNEPMLFQLPMTPPQFEKSLTTSEVRETIEQREDGSQQTVERTIESELKPSDIRRIRLMEDWYFDKQRSMFEVRIIGVAFIAQEADGKITTKFWIYYPHVRRALARAENIVQGGNRAQAYSYTSMLEKRKFSALITKVDNVYDRYINSYTKQQESLYEAERLKREILEFENDLWEY
jgi:gliding motility associated protien GldN